MFPLPIISNTSVIHVPELNLLENEIAAKNMLLHNGSGVNTNAIPFDTNPYCSMKGVSWVNSGQINGSPYRYQVPVDTAINSIFIHCFPNTAIYDQYYQDPSLPSFIRLAEKTSYDNYPAVSRNGLTSIPYMSPWPGLRVDLFVYYDKTTGLVMEYNPHLMTTPIRRYQ